MLKQYAPHRHAPDTPVSMRVVREIAGARLLRSARLLVAKPIWSSPRRGIVVRRWYAGTHPRPPEGMTDTEVDAIGAWIGEHRGQAEDLALPGGNQTAIEITLRRLARAGHDMTLVRRWVAARDLVHGDLRPGNIVRARDGLVIIDTESVSAGHVAWDVAHVIGLVLGSGHPHVRRLIEAAHLSRTEAAQALAFAAQLEAEAR